MAMEVAVPGAGGVATPVARFDTGRELDAWSAGYEAGHLDAELATRPASPPFRPVRDRNRAVLAAIAANHGYTAGFPAGPDGSGWTTLHLTRDHDDDGGAGR